MKRVTRVCSLYGKEVRPGDDFEVPIEGTRPTEYCRTRFDSVHPGVNPPQSGAPCIASEVITQRDVNHFTQPCRRCGMYVQTHRSPDRNENRWATRP